MYLPLYYMFEDTALGIGNPEAGTRSVPGFPPGEHSRALRRYWGCRVQGVLGLGLRFKGQGFGSRLEV